MKRSKRQTIEQRVTQPSKPTHRAKVSLQLRQREGNGRPGYGVAIIAGQEYDLSVRLGDQTLGEIVNPDWFAELKPEILAPVADEVE